MRSAPPSSGSSITSGRSTPPRAAAFHAYVAEESWWLQDYALFRAIHERETAAHGPSGRTDSAGGRQRRSTETARQELAREILFYQYLQWMAGTQWKQAREAATAQAAWRSSATCRSWSICTVPTSGRTRSTSSSIARSACLPTHSAPPGRTGVCPPYNWEAFAKSGFQWLHDRARRSAALYDGYRVDHLVGFFRTYSRPAQRA